MSTASTGAPAARWRSDAPPHRCRARRALRADAGGTGPAIGRVGSGALGGAAVAVAATGTGLATAGTVALGRWPWIATLIGASLVGWAVVDVGLSTGTAPTTLLGEIPLWPLRHALPSLLVPLAVVAVAALGHRRIVGLCVERAAGRAHLVRQVRFALAQQDVRALIVLRRQLGQERPRSRPWFEPARPDPGDQGL